MFPQNKFIFCNVCNWKYRISKAVPFAEVWKIIHSQAFKNWCICANVMLWHGNAFWITDHFMKKIHLWPMDSTHKHKIRSFNLFFFLFFLSPNKLLNKQWNCRWIDTILPSCDIIVMRFVLTGKPSRGPSSVASGSSQDSDIGSMSTETGSEDFKRSANNSFKGKFSRLFYTPPCEASMENSLQKSRSFFSMYISRIGHVAHALFCCG